MPIDLTIFAEKIDNAREDGTPTVLASQGLDGVPAIGHKGSIIVYDADHLAYWEWGLGQAHANITAGGGVAILYFNRDRGALIRAYGHAQVVEDPAVRDAIMARVPQGELDRDPERKGSAVLIRIDRLVEAFSRTTQERD